MATHSVTSGETSTGITLGSGDFLYVSFGGTAISTAVIGGVAEVLSGGKVSFTTVSDGGTEYVYSGSTSSSLTLADLNLYVYGTVVSTTVNDGGVLAVFRGGTAISTTVNAIGTEEVYGTASFTTVNSRGYESISAGGQALRTTVNGGEFVVIGGTAVGTTVNSGGGEGISLHGMASFTTVNSGGEAVYSGGTAISTTLNSGGTEYVHSSGTAVGTTVNSSGYEWISTGGTAISTTVNSRGTEYVYSGGTAVSTTLNGGSEYVYSRGTTRLTTVNSHSYETVHAGGTAISTTLNGGGEYVYSGGTASLTTVNSAGTEYVYSGDTAISTAVRIGGAIDVVYLSYTSGGSASVNSATGVLTVSVGGYGLIRSYAQQLSGDYADEHFQLAQDGGGGTLVTAEAGAPCFCRGTRIVTERGEVAVENLRVGHLVRTVLGKALAPIIWVGRREVDCARHPQPRKVWPVRVSAGVFGLGQPHTDLFLSPDHAVYVADVLIPVKHLINGSTIAQVPVNSITYHHIELAEHDVLLAEGLPTESFLDMRDGTNYANRPGPVRLYPDYSARIWEAFGCARLVVTGPELVAARALVAGSTTDRTAA